ncbi:hypothetical protein BC833DRAFT_588250 [Globomyces pollinis-pini]|nr:hypothetical protein BC833DRAFT_588250 [Globomyces pollinis-pini]
MKSRTCLSLQQMNLKSLYAVALFISSAVAAPTRGIYEGDAVYQFEVSNEEQRSLIASLFKDHTLGLDAWTKLRIGTVDIHVPSKSDKVVLSKLAALKKTVLIKNLQTVIDEEANYSAVNKEKLASNVDNKDLSLEQQAANLFSDYQDADTYQSFLLSLPGVQEIVLGTTYEKRTIRGVKFGAGPKNIFLLGGLHAREWISPAATTYITNFLLGSDPRAVQLREQFTFHTVPVSNPDGYAFTRKSGGQRMWRKNREPNPGYSCIGTDPNRNFDSHWGDTVGASDYPCADDYFGKGPASTAEAAAVSNYLKSLTNTVSFVDLHSFAQEWTFPYGFTCDAQAPYFDDLNKASQLAVASVKTVDGRTFEYGQSCTRLYPTTGSTDDYALDVLKIKYSYTVELRPTGSSGGGFALPASQIVVASKETLEGLITLWQYVATH